jgi:hypothetical protein
MNTEQKHAVQTVVAREESGLLQRLARWLKRPAEHDRAKTPPLESASWPECVGHPYVIGPGTLLIMTYMRTRLPALDEKVSPAPTVPE